MVDSKNSESSERDCVANVLNLQDKISTNTPSFNQSIKKIDTVCDQIQSLYHIVNMLERRMTMLEKELCKQTSSAINL